MVRHWSSLTALFALLTMSVQAKDKKRFCRPVSSKREPVRIRTTGCQLRVS